MLLIHSSKYLSVSEGPSHSSTPKTVTTDLISFSACTRIIMTSLSFRLGQLFSSFLPHFKFSLSSFSTSIHSKSNIDRNEHNEIAQSFRGDRGTLGHGVHWDKPNISCHYIKMAQIFLPAGSSANAPPVREISII